MERCEAPDLIRHLHDDRQTPPLNRSSPWGEMPAGSNLRHCLFIAALATISLTGCSVFKRVFTPEQYRQEKAAEKKRAEDAKITAEMAKVPDGECATAESCLDYCQALSRALDCYKTGKAALKGRDVSTAGGWRTETVAGSTDDVNVRYEEESVEHESMLPVARDAFARACTAGHAESCRMSGDLVTKDDKPDAAPNFYRKACELHDEQACAKVSGSGNAKASGRP